MYACWYEYLVLVLVFNEHAVIQSIAEEGVATQGGHVGSGNGVGLQEKHMHESIQPTVLHEWTVQSLCTYVKDNRHTAKNGLLQ